MWRAAYILLAVGLLSGCNLFQPKQTSVQPEEEPLARVYDKYLYPSDLEGIAQDLSGQDSVDLINLYVQEWVKSQTILQVARENLPEDLSDIESLVEKYRQDLILYNYEEALVSQKFDSTISIQDIRAYYTEHKADFNLPEDVFRLHYIKLPAFTTRADTMMNLLKSDVFEDQEKLKAYAQQYAVSYQLGDSSWTSLGNVLSVLPVEESDISAVAGWKKYEQVEGEEYIYLYRIHDKRIKGGTAPLPYVKKEIRGILKEKKKMQMINEVYTTIYEDARENQSFEIY